MIKKWLLILRDFSHVFLKRQNNTETTPYPIYLFLVLIPYYFILSSVPGIISNRLGISFTGIIGDNIILLFLLGVVIFGPFIYVNKWIVRWLKPVPLPDDLPKNTYRCYAVAFVLTFILGFVLIPFFINTVNAIWPPNEFYRYR